MTILKRKIEDELLNWKKETNKLPLIVEGARQVGKTYSILKFGEENYNNVIYLNFILNPEYMDIFSGSLSVDDIISLITIFIPDKKITPGDTLIFLDEIQDCPNALVSLKSFGEDKRYDIIASGSLLGMATSKHSSFPVGYVKTVEMYAMDFQEFLMAHGNESQITNFLINTFRNQQQIPTALNAKISQLFKTYLIIGGLPRSVLTYLESRDFNRVDKEKKEIIHGYFRDIGKYGNLAEKNKANDLLLSIPKQLLKDNKKFQFSKVRKHARARDYEDALMWLFESGVTDSCNRMDDLDTKTYDYTLSDTNYQVFIKDTGLLITMYDNRNIWSGIMNGNYFINNGSILKNYVFDALRKQNLKTMYFQKKTGFEIEFITNINDTLIPLSLRENINANQALNIFLKETGLPFGYKISENYFAYDKNSYTIPVYSLYLIEEFSRIINTPSGNIKKQLLDKDGAQDDKGMLR